MRKHRRVTGLARPDEHDQRVAVAIDELVDLRRQPAPGTTQGVVSGLGPQILVVRPCPLWGG